MVRFERLITRRESSSTTLVSCINDVQAFVRPTLLTISCQWRDWGYKSPLLKIVVLQAGEFLSVETVSSRQRWISNMSCCARPSRHSSMVCKLSKPDFKAFREGNCRRLDLELSVFWRLSWIDVAWEVMESSRASESSSVALSLWCVSDHSEASQLRSSSFPNNAFDMDGKRAIAKVEKWPKHPNMYGSRQPPKGPPLAGASRFYYTLGSAPGIHEKTSLPKHEPPLIFLAATFIVLMLAWLVSFPVWPRYNGELVWSKQSTEGQRADRKQHAALSESKSWAWLTPKAREQGLRSLFCKS